MEMHKMQGVVNEDHRVLVEIQRTIRPGPVDLFVVGPTADEAEPALPPPAPDAVSRWQAMRAELAADPRPFHELSLDQRRARMRRLRGVGKGLLSSSEEFARRKREEIKIEERKLAR